MDMTYILNIISDQDPNHIIYYIIIILYIYIILAGPFCIYYDILHDLYDKTRTQNIADRDVQLKGAYKVPAADMTDHGYFRYTLYQIKI